MYKIKKNFNKLYTISENKYIGITNLNKFNYNLVKSPDFQRILNNEKIEEIQEHIKYNDKYPIITLEMGYLYEEYYLIDGQHRLAALNKTGLLNYEFEIHLSIINTNEELKHLFKLINKNTPIPDDWLLINNINDVKSNMIDIFNSYLFKDIIKNSQNPHRPHISRPKLENLITELYNSNRIIKLQHFKKLNDIYKDYSENNFPNTTGKTNVELLETCKKKNCYLGMVIIKYEYELLKEHLINVFENNEINKINYISKKQKISKTIRTACWENYLSETNQNTYDIKCPIKICNNIINPHTFQCGHIISEKNGGKVKLNNLRPICQSCNGSMGIRNWTEFDNN